MSEHKPFPPEELAGQFDAGYHLPTGASPPPPRWLDGRAADRVRREARRHEKLRRPRSITSPRADGARESDTSDSPRVRARTRVELSTLTTFARGGGARLSAARRLWNQAGGSRGLGRTYFFLAELLLLELDLLPLLLLLEVDELFFAPPDFDAALAMLFSLSGPVNCRFGATVPEPAPGRPFRVMRSPLVLTEQIGYEHSSTGGARPR